MFQTEPIHLLQSFASDGMTAFMLAVSSLGYTYTLIPLVIVITFGVDFRRGFVLIETAVWTAFATDVLKNAFALPRPEAVDSTLLQPGDSLPEWTPLERGGAPDFWSVLPAESIAYNRGLGDPSFGLPSGHCSVTTALWASMAALFRSGWLWGVAGSLILLMPLSRMYLARHFLADVLGGIGVGLAALGLAWPAAIGPLRDPGRRSLLTRVALEPSLLRTLLLLGTPPLALLIPDADVETVLRIFGLQLSLWLLTRYGLPVAGVESVGARAARVLVAFSLYLLTDRALGGLAERALGESDRLDAGISALSAFAGVWGTTRICYRLGLYRRGQPGVGLLEAGG